jgi:hypothetical protein
MSSEPFISNDLFLLYSDMVIDKVDTIIRKKEYNFKKLYAPYWKKEVSLGFEPRLQESESCVLTVTL